ncbi:MAG: APC family permease, partial [Faecalibacterium sp.]
TPNVKKELTKLDVVSIAFGAIIGWGCFVLPGDVFLPQAGPLGTALGIGIGAILVMIISQSYGYLIQKLPGSGGEFSYIKAAFGKRHAFAGAWFLVLAYVMIIPLNATALGLLLRTFFPTIANIGPLYSISDWTVTIGELLPAILAVVMVAYINIKGVKSAGWIQTAISLLLLGSVLVITAMCMLSPAASFSNLLPLFHTSNDTHWAVDVLSIVAVSAWAFMGFDCIPQMSDEYNFPHKHSRRLMFLSIAFAALMYISINTITAMAMPWQELVTSSTNWATGEAVAYLTGNVGLAIIAVAMFCAILSGLNGFFMSSTRLVHALAQARALPTSFSKVHKTHATPITAIYFVASLSIMAVFFGRSILSLVVDMTSVGTSFVFLYSTAAAIKLARAEENRKQCYISFVGMAAAAFLLILLVIPCMPGYIGHTAMALLFIWIVLGFIFYFIDRKRYLSLDNESYNF